MYNLDVNPFQNRCLDTQSAPLMFLTKTKKSEDETFFPTYYDTKQIRISQEKHLSSGFPGVKS